MIFRDFKGGIFPIKPIESTGHSDMLSGVAKVSDWEVSDHSYLKILTPTQMLQKLPTALAQVKVRNTSENLQNEIQQIVY